MIRDKNKLIVLIVVITVVVGSTLIIFSNNNKDKIKDKTNTVINNGKGENDVVVKDITFSGITKNYDGGITTITANMLNKTDAKKSFKLEIILKDNDNKVVKSIIQVIENLEPDKTKVLTSGIAGDYEYIENIEFKVLENSIK